MNTTGTQLQGTVSSARAWSWRWAASNSVFESLGAVGVIVLSIVGLSGVDSTTVAAIAAILLGAFLISEGGLSSRRFLSYAAGILQVTEVEAGISADFMAGLAGIVLGILALFGISPPTLLGAALLAYGASVLFSGAAFSRLLSWTGFSATETGAVGFQQLMREAYALSGNHFFAGMAALVLGILAVIGLSSMVLTLVGFLTLGAAGFFSGFAHWRHWAGSATHA